MQLALQLRKHIVRLLLLRLGSEDTFSNAGEGIVNALLIQSGGLKVGDIALLGEVCALGQVGTLCLGELQVNLVGDNDNGKGLAAFGVLEVGADEVENIDDGLNAFARRGGENQHDAIGLADLVDGNGGVHVDGEGVVDGQHVVIVVAQADELGAANAVARAEAKVGVAVGILLGRG